MKEESAVLGKTSVADFFLFPNVFAYKNNKICKFKTLWNRGTHSK